MARRIRRVTNPGEPREDERVPVRVVRVQSAVQAQQRVQQACGARRHSRLRCTLAHAELLQSQHATVEVPKKLKSIVVKAIRLRLRSLEFC